MEKGVQNAGTYLQVKWISIFWGSQTHPLLLNLVSLKSLQSGQQTVNALNSEEAAHSHHLLRKDLARKTTRKKAWNTVQHICGLVQTRGKQFLGIQRQFAWSALKMTARTSKKQLNIQVGSSEEPQENTAISNRPADSSPVHTLIVPSAIHSPFLSQLSFGTWKMQETIALASPQHSACPVSTGGERGEQHKWGRDGDERHCPFEIDIYRYFLPSEVSALSSQSVQNIYSQMFAERAPLTCTGRRIRSLYIATCCLVLCSQCKKGETLVIPLHTALQLAALLCPL